MIKNIKVMKQAGAAIKNKTPKNI